MPSARGIRAGAAYVELYAQDNRLVRGLKRAQRRLRAFSASVRDIGMRLAKLSVVFATPFIAGASVTRATPSSTSPWRPACPSG